MSHVVGNEARSVGAVVDRGVDHVTVHALPQNASRAVDEWLDENRCVNLIDVVLMHHRGVEPVQSIGDFLREVRLAEVEHVGKESAQQSHNYRDAHEQILFVATNRFSRAFDSDSCSKHWSKKMLKAVVDANQSADHRKQSQ